MEMEQLVPTGQQKQSSHKARWVVLVVTFLVLACVIAGGIWQRSRAEAALVHSTEEASVATVNVVHPVLDATGTEVTLPGSAQAFQDTPIYARTGGYLKDWKFDIGSRVRKGQLLADIEAPELDQQLLQARANLATAQSNLALATITANRDERLLKTNSIATQDRDNAAAAASATKTTAEASAAEVARLEQLKSYQKIYAPFDGVITARNTDNGALIDAGAGSAKELFHLSATNKLRIFVSIPESWSLYARPGVKATISLTEYPNRLFPCTFVRSSGAIDVNTRTLNTEFDVDNPTGEILPGSFVQLHLHLPPGSTSLTIPSNTLLFRTEGLRVGLVKNGKTKLVPVTIGHDYGLRVEILSGLQPDDQVILDPSDSLIDGLSVRIHATQGQKAQKAQSE